MVRSDYKPSFILFFTLFVHITTSNIYDLFGNDILLSKWAESGSIQVSTSRWTYIETKFSDFRHGLVFLSLPKLQNKNQVLLKIRNVVHQGNVQFDVIAIPRNRSTCTQSSFKHTSWPYVVVNWIVIEKGTYVGEFSKLIVDYSRIGPGGTSLDWPDEFSQDCDLNIEKKNRDTAAPGVILSLQTSNNELYDFIPQVSSGWLKSGPTGCVRSWHVGDILLQNVGQIPYTSDLIHDETVAFMVFSSSSKSESGFSYSSLSCSEGFSFEFGSMYASTTHSDLIKYNESFYNEEPGIFATVVSNNNRLTTPYLKLNDWKSDQSNIIIEEMCGEIVTNDNINNDYEVISYMIVGTGTRRSDSIQCFRHDIDVITDETEFQFSSGLQLTIDHKKSYNQQESERSDKIINESDGSESLVESSVPSDRKHGNHLKNKVNKQEVPATTTTSTSTTPTIMPSRNIIQHSKQPIKVLRFGYSPTVSKVVPPPPPSTTSSLRIITKPKTTESPTKRPFRIKVFDRKSSPSVAPTLSPVIDHIQPSALKFVRHPPVAVVDKQKIGTGRTAPTPGAYQESTPSAPSLDRLFEKRRFPTALPAEISSGGYDGSTKTGTLLAPPPSPTDILIDSSKDTEESTENNPSVGSSRLGKKKRSPRDKGVPKSLSAPKDVIPSLAPVSVPQSHYPKPSQPFKPIQKYRYPNGDAYGSPSLPTSGTGTTPSAPSSGTGTTPSAPSSGTGTTPSAPSSGTGTTPSAPSSGTGNTPSAPSSGTGTTPSAPSSGTGTTPSAPSSGTGTTPSAPSSGTGTTPSAPSSGTGTTPSAPSSGTGTTPSAPSSGTGTTPSAPSSGTGTTPSAPSSGTGTGYTTSPTIVGGTHVPTPVEYNPAYSNYYYAEPAQSPSPTIVGGTHEPTTEDQNPSPPTDGGTTSVETHEPTSPPVPAPTSPTTTGSFNSNSKGSSNANTSLSDMEIELITLLIGGVALATAIFILRKAFLAGAGVGKPTSNLGPLDVSRNSSIDDLVPSNDGKGLFLQELDLESIEHSTHSSISDPYNSRMRITVDML